MPYDPAILLLGMHSTEMQQMTYEHICRNTFSNDLKV